jgi:dolichyl-phosphate beta-glucosyltransferase
MFLSVIIPAYNEEKRLPTTLEEIDKYLSKQTYDYEIIVISDGSKDNTVNIVRSYSLKIKNLKLIDNKENHGKGYVVRQAMLQAKGDYRLFTDADNSTSIDQVEKMWPFFERDYDIVIGSRDVKGAVLAVPQSFQRRILGDTFNLVVKIVAGFWGISDTQCGFKGFTARAAESIFPKCKIDRWAFDVEILVIAKKMGYKIKEMPVTWINDPNSKVKLKGMIKMLFEVLQIRLNSIKGKYG